VDPTGSGPCREIFHGFLSDGESLHCQFGRNWQPARTWTSVGRLFAGLTTTLDKHKNPATVLLIDFKQDFAGVVGDVRYLNTQIELALLPPLVADIVG